MSGPVEIGLHLICQETLGFTLRGSVLAPKVVLSSTGLGASWQGPTGNASSPKMLLAVPLSRRGPKQAFALSPINVKYISLKTDFNLSKPFPVLT